MTEELFEAYAYSLAYRFLPQNEKPWKGNTQKAIEYELLIKPQPSTDKIKKILRKNPSGDSKMVQDFLDSVQLWKSTIKTMRSIIGDEKTLHNISLKTKFIPESLYPAMPAEFKEFNSYLIQRRDTDNCSPEELGRLATLLTAYQKTFKTIAPQSDNTSHDFVAIDFETATNQHSSICSVGIVTITNGNITEKYNTLVQPPKNEYAQSNMRIHGITPAMTLHAPNFQQIYPEIKRRIDNKNVVAHNAKGFDAKCLKKAMELYGITDNLNIKWIDTLDEYKVSLDKACAAQGIEITHHDALSDAVACACLHLNYLNGSVPQNTQQPRKYRERKKLDSRFDTEDNPFKGMRIVISGTFYTWTNRDELCDLLETLGARISSSVSGSTNLLVAGMGAGYRKIEQMNENINNGKNAKIVNENGIIDLLSRHGFNYPKVDLPISDKSSLTETIDNLSYTLPSPEDDNW